MSSKLRSSANVKNPDLLWTDKYRPIKISDIIGNTDVIKRMENWLKRYQEAQDYNRPDPELERCILLTGQSGLGKTSSASCILNAYGYQIKEFNASDIRTKTQVNESLYNLIDVKQVLRTRPIAIIMDEIDGMSGGDKGGLSELIRYINPNRGKGNRKKEDQEKKVPLPPIICICNNIGDKKLQDFRKDCLELAFKLPNHKDLEILLKRICRAEKLNLDQDAIDLVIDYSQGDYRRLINYLQSLDSLLIDNNVVLGAQEIEQCNFIIGQKSMDMNLEKGVRHLITNSEVDPGLSLQVYNNHKSQFICSIYENYVQLTVNNSQIKPLPFEVTNTKSIKTNRVMGKLDQISQVIDDITWSDMVDKIMHKNQLWYLHKVHGLLSCHLPSVELHSNQIDRLNYSSSWSKFNLQKCNEKDIYNLSSKLKTNTGDTDVQILSQIILHNLLDSDQDPVKMNKAIQLLKGYGLDYNHIKTLIKIDRLSEHSKYTGKIERILKTHFPNAKKKGSDGIIRRR